MTRQELLTVLRHGSHAYDLDADAIMDAAADEIERLDISERRLVCAAVLAHAELNAIRARDGVPYCRDGYPSSVSPEWFCSVVDQLDDAVQQATGQTAHCHPELYKHNEAAEAAERGE